MSTQPNPEDVNVTLEREPQVFNTESNEQWKELFDGEPVRKQSDMTPQEIEVARQRWLKMMMKKVRKQKRGITKAKHDPDKKKSKRKTQKLARKKNR